MFCCYRAEGRQCQAGSGNGDQSIRGRQFADFFCDFLRICADMPRFHLACPSPKNGKINAKVYLPQEVLLGPLRLLRIFAANKDLFLSVSRPSHKKRKPQSHLPQKGARCAKRSSGPRMVPFATFAHFCG
jgi:hypothetical protein